MTISMNYISMNYMAPDVPPTERALHSKPPLTAHGST